MPDIEGFVSGDECKAAVIDGNLKRVGHHKCGACGAMTMHVFVQARHVFVEPLREGFASVDEPIAGYDPSCNCVIRSNPIHLMNWDEFANTFNMQKTRHARFTMWERFKAGKPTHEADEE